MNKVKKVFKFGGASLKDAAAIKNAAKILEAYKNESLFVVVSATGKTTNALEQVVAAHYKQDGTANQLWEEIKQRHFRLLLALIEDQNHDLNVQNNRYS